MAMSEKFKNRFLGYFIVFCLLLLVIVGFLNFKSQADAEKQLAKSVRNQLIATCVAAREVIDLPKFVELNSEADTHNNPDYLVTLQKLRNIAANVGAKYIYVLKRDGDEYKFVYDTDTENPTVFIPYDISPVHQEAFNGRIAADIMNVKDEYGSFSTGAAPLWRGGKVVGVISTDIEDKLMVESHEFSRRNTYLLIGSILATMIAMSLLMHHLLRQIKTMQEKLALVAHMDAVTGLPNRACLMEYLADLGKQTAKVPFAIYFIDLDNFKQVNDIAGHDAGDQLLQHIGQYLAKQHGQTATTRVFRPAAGRLNIAARVGGDEFVIVVPHVSSPEEAKSIADDILSGFAKENIDEHIRKFKVGMSIGIALYPSQAEDYNVLIKYADIAMYHAKNAGKNCYRLYNDELPAKPDK